MCEMKRYEMQFGVFLFVVLFTISQCGVVKFRKPMINYPRDTVFWATDFFVRGCKNFLDKCPKAYKYQHICARSYNGEFRDFPSYCEMQYENCNTWRNWHVYKRAKC